jgi:Holliday junction resolvase RusA-like endonuclease
MTITLTIPGLPTAKGRPRIGKLANGRPVAFTPEKTRTREGVVAALAMDVMASRPALTCPVEVVVEAVLPIARSWRKSEQQQARDGIKWPIGRPDLDNLVKLVTDGCNGIVWADDSQIVFLLARKSYGDIPKTVIHVTPVSP